MITGACNLSLDHIFSLLSRTTILSPIQPLACPRYCVDEQLDDLARQECNYTRAVPLPSLVARFHHMSARTPSNPSDRMNLALARVGSGDQATPLEHSGDQAR